MSSKPKFKTNQEALEYFTKEYQDLTDKYEMSGDDYWVEAENSSEWDEDYKKILELARSIGMCRYLIDKENKNGQH